MNPRAGSARRLQHVGIVLALGLGAGGGFPRALAQEKPAEDALFGGSSENTAPSSTHKSAPEAGAARSDSEELSSSGKQRDAFAEGEVTDNPLQIGGVFYQRFTLAGQQSVNIGNSSMSLPLQVDGFLDARPSDRLRIYISPRLMYDPSRDQYSNTTGGNSAALNAFTSGAASTLTVSSANTIPNNPGVNLDNAWIKFDIARHVFVTVGRQHVKWGTSRFWNPTDVLSSQIRNPVLNYDLRLGNAMLKVDVPWEAAKMNFYAITLLDNPTASSTLGQLGAAFRVDKTFGSTEIGIDIVSRTGRTLLYGADISTPLGPIDFYAEAAVISGGDFANVTLHSAITTGAELTSLYSMTGFIGPQVRTSGGLSYSFGYSDNRQATIGAEYMYNSVGAANSNVYPVLIFNGLFQPFYVGKHYAALYATADGPDAEKHTSFNFSGLANLSDMSFLPRLGFTWRALTYLTFEAFADVHLGNTGGEFNFSLSTPAITYSGFPVAALSIPATLFDVGMGLRLSF